MCKKFIKEDWEERQFISLFLEWNWICFSQVTSSDICDPSVLSRLTLSAGPLGILFLQHLYRVDKQDCYSEHWGALELGWHSSHLYTLPACTCSAVTLWLNNWWVGLFLWVGWVMVHEGALGRTSLDLNLPSPLNCISVGRLFSTLFLHFVL